MKRIVCILCLMAMVVSMVSCGSKESDSESTSDSAVATEESVTDESENLPFAEREGIEFTTESSFTIDAETCFVDENGDETTYEGVEPTDNPRRIWITNATKTDLNDGTVSYTIEFEYEDYFGYTRDKNYSYDNISVGVNSKCFGILDYYTGIGESTHNEGRFETTINWQDKEYNLFYARGQQPSESNGWETLFEDDTSITRANVGHAYESITITASADYDGLLLYTLKGEYTSSSDDDDEEEEYWTAWDPVKYPVKNYYFIKVDDLVKEFENN